MVASQGNPKDFINYAVPEVGFDTRSSIQSNTFHEWLGCLKDSSKATLYKNDLVDRYSEEDANKFLRCYKKNLIDTTIKSDE
jgi:hypothetical protein